MYLEVLSHVSLMQAFVKFVNTIGSCICLVQASVSRQQIYYFKSHFYAGWTGFLDYYISFYHYFYRYVLFSESNNIRSIFNIYVSQIEKEEKV